MGKSTISMAMSNSYVTNYQRVFQNSRKEKTFQMVQLCSAPPRRASRRISSGAGAWGKGDPGGNSAWLRFGFWKVVGFPNFQVAQEIVIDVQPNYGLWIFFRVIIGLDTFTFEAGSQWLFNSTAFCIE